ncbi:BSD domain-containing protein [Forsythia ovata]|uniref:BSD domain-containing protein n=1 Tax=Forsythia ovata TaxID=205694 RepID=A0ABD1SIZ1_9LAMI
MNDTDDDEEDLDEDEDGVVGITEEVLDFVSKITSRPELWTDFPISLPDDVDMSDYQREHASEIERLVPSLVYLRQKISSQISHGKFWMIYFILLLPRLNEDDLKLLSTPEVVEMRESLLQKLQNKSNAPQERFENSETVDSSKEDGGKEVEETTGRAQCVRQDCKCDKRDESC